MALDECRLLILGAQVLFGCQFQMAFQEGFQKLPASSRATQAAGLLALTVAVGLLIAPCMTHQIAYHGEDRMGALRLASRCAGAAMAPVTLGLGATTFVVFERLFGYGVGVLAATLFALTAFSFLYALGFFLKRRKETPMPSSERQTSLKDKIEQLLTEARVIIPGAQALLGFQFVVVFARSFSELSMWIKLTHALGTGAVAFSVILLMTPAALHRIAYEGENSPTFFRIGSALVVASAFSLAVGIASDIGVVLFKIAEDARLALWGGGFFLLVLLTLWFFYPFSRRSAAATGT